MNYGARTSPTARISTTMRGGVLHNLIAAEVRRILKAEGFWVGLERPVRLEDGRRDFVDVLARRGSCILGVEVETSPRGVVGNVAKARSLGLPLWVVTPNGRIRGAVLRKLARSGLGSVDGICVLTLGQLREVVVDCLSLFSPANGLGENRKTTPAAGHDGDRGG